jgi:hypothetical protein
VKLRAVHSLLRFAEGHKREPDLFELLAHWLS